MSRRLRFFRTLRRAERKRASKAWGRLFTYRDVAITIGGVVFKGPFMIGVDYAVG